MTPGAPLDRPAGWRHTRGMATTDVAELLNRTRVGWTRAMNLDLVTATADEVVARLVVDEMHLQPLGLVHGGVHCGVIESICSVGAAVSAVADGRAVVGLENHTSFVRAARPGAKLTARATPITRGRRTQVWEATITDDAGKTVATGRVRLLCIEPEGMDEGGRTDMLRQAVTGEG